MSYTFAASPGMNCAMICISSLLKCASYIASVEEYDGVAEEIADVEDLAEFASEGLVPGAFAGRGRGETLESGRSLLDLCGGGSSPM